MDGEYGTLSAMFYDCSKPPGHSLNGDIEFYQELLQGVPGRILEAGVGTGRLLIPLLQSGKVVDGVDLSGPMLEKCQANLDRHGLKATLYQQDLAHLSLPHRYDAIVMPTGSFCLLPREVAIGALRSFREYLNPGGELIVDLEMPNLEAEEGRTARLALNSGADVVLTNSAGTFDAQAQTTSYVNTYQLVDNGEVVETQSCEMVLHWYKAKEFEALLSKSGFERITKVVGYGIGSPGIITFKASPQGGYFI